MEAMKPFLLVFAIGLVGVALQSARLADGTQGTASLARYFDALVNECRAEHPEWERATCVRVARGDFWIGMTTGMAHASLGRPIRVERSPAGCTSCEEWTVATGRYGLQILRFEDGILVSSRLANPDCPACQISPPGS